MGWMVWSLDLGRNKRFFSSPHHPDRHLGPPCLLFNGYQGSFLHVKRPGREVNHLPPFSAEIKNGWSYTCIPPISLHCVDKVVNTLLILELQEKKKFTPRSMTPASYCTARSWPCISVSTAFLLVSIQYSYQGYSLTEQKQNYM